MSNKPNLWPINGGKSRPLGNVAQMNNAIEIKVDQCSSFHCPECLASAFRDAVQLLEVSRLVTGTPQDQVMRIPAFQCVQCGRVVVQAQLRKITPAERDEILAKAQVEDKVPIGLNEGKSINEVKEEVEEPGRDESGDPEAWRGA